MSNYNIFGDSQTQFTPGVEGEARNSAGGVSFKLDKWGQLMRFLILGSEGGTYYASERALTLDNAKNLLACLKEDSERTVQTIVDVSVSGRAPKKDPAIFALAVACAHGDEAGKAAAYAAIHKVCRIGTHLFTFLSLVTEMRGWSAGLRRGVGKFYTEKSVDRLALQLVKYRERSGWSHRDALRLSHPKAPSEQHNELFRYGVGKLFADSESGRAFSTFEKASAHIDATQSGGAVELAIPSHRLISAYEEASGIVTVNVENTLQLAKLIADSDLPREGVPNQFLNEVSIWEALLNKMPVTAMVRNLGKMTSVGLFKDKDNVQKVVDTLSNQELLTNSRIHPMQVLLAIRTYGDGHGFRGKLSWTPNKDIMMALQGAFYKTFGNVEPTGQRYMVALDVSDSMAVTINKTNISAAEASGAMALITNRVEENVHNVAFADSTRRGGWSWDAVLNPVDLEGQETLSGVMQELRKYTFGRTDCSLPMMYARKNELEVDTFIVYTDNETYAGAIKPFQALQQYRKASGIDAKLIVVGMTSTGFSIADPSDPGMLDVVGFDTATPQLISQFSRGLENID